VLNLTLQDLLIRACAYALVALVSGVLSGAVLAMLGGKPAKEGEGVGWGGLDAVGLVFSVLFRQGWGRSSQPEPGGMRGGRLGLVLWVLATLALTYGAVWLLPYARTPLASFGTNVFTQGGISVINATSDLGIWFVILSILPIPPLLGGNLLLALLPRLRPAMRKFYWPGTAIVALIVGLGFAEAVLQPVWTLLRGWLI